MNTPARHAAETNQNKKIHGKLSAGFARNRRLPPLRGG
jgi:hypothetical protein